MRDTINDCYVDLVGHKPTEEEIDDIIHHLSYGIIHLAGKWGWNDTEVREKVFEWLKVNL